MDKYFFAVRVTNGVLVKETTFAGSDWIFAHMSAEATFQGTEWRVLWPRRSRLHSVYP